MVIDQHLCSTSDSKWDRKYLRENVFPHLRQFCQSLGLQFHVVDLYHNFPASWAREERQGGGEEEAGGSQAMRETELQEVLHLALWEIRMCQDVSAGPTFVVCWAWLPLDLCTTYIQYTATPMQE